MDNPKLTAELFANLTSKEKIKSVKQASRNLALHKKNIVASDILLRYKEVINSLLLRGFSNKSILAFLQHELGYQFSTSTFRKFLVKENMTKVKKEEQKNVINKKAVIGTELPINEQKNEMESEGLGLQAVVRKSAEI